MSSPALELYPTHQDFLRVERLRGNVGYLDVTSLPPVSLGDAPLRGAMALVANASALVIDLRRCQLADRAMASLLASYLFDTEALSGPEVYAPDAAWLRAEDADGSTAPLPFPRYAGGPVYVLTGDDTGPVAAELARDLAHLGRAVVVGAPSGGRVPSVARPPHHARDLLNAMDDALGRPSLDRVRPAAARR